MLVLGSRLPTALVKGMYDRLQWVVSLSGLILLLSGITMCTHRPQAVVIVGIYMSSNIYY